MLVLPDAVRHAQSSKQAAGRVFRTNRSFFRSGKTVPICTRQVQEDPPGPEDSSMNPLGSKRATAEPLLFMPPLRLLNTVRLPQQIRRQETSGSNDLEKRTDLERSYGTYDQA